MWPFTRRPPLERPLKNRVAGAVLRDQGLQAALNRLGGFPKSLEIRELDESHLLVPWRLDDWVCTLHCWCPVLGRDDALTAQRTRQLLSEAGVRFPTVLHEDFSEEAAEHRGVWSLLEHTVAGAPRPEDRSGPEVVASLAEFLVRLHGPTSSVAGQPWRAKNPHQPWSRWVVKRTEALLRALETEDSTRAGGVGWLRERFTERHQPDEVFVPFNLTLGSEGWDGLIITPEGELIAAHPSAVIFAPFERDLAEGSLWLPPHLGDAFIDEYLARRGPRERQRVHLNLGPLRAFAALERAQEPGGWERLLRIADRDL